jgi:hypothetical protein
MSVSDDSFFLKHLRDLPERHPPLDVDDLGQKSFRGRPEEKPAKGSQDEKEQDT